MNTTQIILMSYLLGLHFFRTIGHLFARLVELSRGIVQWDEWKLCGLLGLQSVIVQTVWVPVCDCADCCELHWVTLQTVGAVVCDCEDCWGCSVCLCRLLGLLCVIVQTVGGTVCDCADFLFNIEFQLYLFLMCIT